MATIDVIKYAFLIFKLNKIVFKKLHYITDKRTFDTYSHMEDFL